jgi:hypothetical protein
MSTPSDHRVEPNAEVTPETFQVSSAFRGEIRPLRSSPLYALAMVLITGVMLLLPVAYLAIVGLMGWLVWWHATTNHAVFENARGAGSAKVAALIYIAPLFAGVIGVLFMFKPLFAPRGRHPEPHTVTASEEPVLHAYVGTLCRIMGAPIPRRIDVDCDVNASASLRRGFLSMIGNDLVLTVGLPLVAGLSLRDLTCILAHEFGHFTQGWAMRLGYVVWRINRWFARVVYERDGWDERLDEWREESGHWIVSIIVCLAALFVWVSRQILKVLMYVGLAVSTFLSRQQEFDADAWASRVVGSEPASGVPPRVMELIVCRELAMNEVSERWSSRQLPDNLMSLDAAARSRIPAQARAAIDRSLRSSNAGFFSTHPSDRQRVERIRMNPEPGVLRVDGPATILFKNFDDVCRKASYLHYRAIVGEAIFETTLVPTTTVVHQSERRRVHTLASTDFLLGLVSPLVPIPVSHEAGAAPADPKAALDALRVCRAELAPLVPSIPTALAALSQADDRLDALAGLDAVREAGLIVVPSRFHLHDASPRTLADERAKVESAAEAARRSLDRAAALLARRLDLALSILRLPDASKRVPDAAARLDSIDALLLAYHPTLEALRTLWPCHRTHRVCIHIAEAVQREKDHEVVRRRFRNAGEDIHRRLQSARAMLAGLRYDPPEQPGKTLASAVGGVIPPADAFPAILEAGPLAARSLTEVSQAMLSDLAAHARAVEDALRLPPLSDNAAVRTA